MPLPPLSKKASMHQDEYGDDSYSDDSYSDADFDEEDEEGQADLHPGSVCSSGTDDVPFFGDPAYASSTSRSSAPGSATSTPQSSARGFGGTPSGSTTASVAAASRAALVNTNRGGIRSRQRAIEQKNPTSCALNKEFLPTEDCGAHPLSLEQQQQKQKQQESRDLDIKSSLGVPGCPDINDSHRMEEGDFYESDYSGYEDDNSECQQSETGVYNEDGIQESLSLPLLTSGSGSISHHVVTGGSERLRETKAFNHYMDSVRRPWIQQRAKHVHQTKSVFSTGGRPRLPGVVVRTTNMNVNAKVFNRILQNDYSQGSTNTCGKIEADSRIRKVKHKKGRKRKRKKKRKLKNVQSESMLVLPTIMESPSRIAPGGNHKSMLATAERRKMWLEKSHSMTSLCINLEDAKELQSWLFERLMAIMKVYRLRTKDLFVSLDRDSDGIISCGDMRESLQVLGLHSITQKETTRLIKRIAQMQPGNSSKRLNFDAFQFAFRRSNIQRESMLARRQGHYMFEQNAIAEKITASQKNVKALIATAATDMDATRDIQDSSGRDFWKRRFSCHTPSVPLWRLIKELKQHLWMNTIGDSMSQKYGGARLLHPRAKFSASIAGRRPPTSTNDKWVCRRIAILLGGDMKKKISSLQFGDLLHTFGPFDRLFENVLLGPLESSRQRKRRESRQKDLGVKGKPYSITRGNTVYRRA